VEKSIQNRFLDSTFGSARKDRAKRMNEANSQPERPKAAPQFSQEQYDMLKRCSDKKDITEWNEWRKEHPDAAIWLQGSNFKGWWLQKANFMHGPQFYESTGTYITFEEVHLERAVFEWTDLQNADFTGANMDGTRLWSANAQGAYFHGTSLMDAELEVANFENCDFCDAILVNASFSPARLNGAKFTASDLRGCSMRACVVDGATRFWECKVNRYSRNERFTDLTGTTLDTVIVDPGTKQLLQYNVRRSNWEQWYKFKDRGNWRDSGKERRGFSKVISYLVRFFWWVSDYGISAPRIIKVFAVAAVAFAIIYYLWGLIAPPGIVDYLFVDPNGVKVGCGMALLRAVHFSVVIMTVGFTNMHANAHSFWAHILVGFQMILGFVLLGALVTRFAVLFTAGGPAGKFADEKTICQRLKERWNKIKKKG